MRTLPKLVAQTRVGKRVDLKIWRSQKLITKKVLLGRLESSKEFKAENKIESDTSKYVKVESLKIFIRDLNKDDISERKLPKNTTGVVVTEIFEGSPLMFVAVYDVIVELQKKKIKNFKKDISNYNELKSLPKYDLIVDCCAEAAVEKSRKEVDKVFNTNLVGTFNILKKCKIIFILSPNHTHFKYIAKFHKDKYIFCEKPPVNSIPGFKP